MDQIQLGVFVAGQRFNDLTGYSDIEKLKMRIESSEKKVRDMRNELTEAKEAHAKAIGARSAAQRQINELLERKHQWSSDDLEKFTQLYRSEHELEEQETEAENRLMKAEREADAAQDSLTQAILSRYHEEQIWSDKIRRASTWGTWILMAFNVGLFVVVQLGLEPWKRQRLVYSFDEKVREAL
ncbi:hypothetical protein CANCADRAFT_14223, partial [Tortispora caseinolytica NRRL Y-17796]